MDTYERNIKTRVPNETESTLHLLWERQRIQWLTVFSNPQASFLLGRIWGPDREVQIMCCPYCTRQQSDSARQECYSAEPIHRSSASRSHCSGAAAQLDRFSDIESRWTPILHLSLQGLSWTLYVTPGQPPLAGLDSSVWFHSSYLSVIPKPSIWTRRQVAKPCETRHNDG